MNKKLRTSLTAMLLALSLVWLAACGEGDKTTNTPDASPAVEQGEQQNQEEPTGEAEADTGEAEVEADPAEEQTGAGTTSSAEKDLFVAIVGEANNLNSFSVEMIADQKLDMAGQAMDSVMSSMMDVTMKPNMAFKQLTKIEAEGVTQEMESYFTAEGFFMKNPETGAWMKMPQEMMDMALQGASQDALDPSAQLKDLVDYADQLTVVENDGIYTFTLTASGEAFTGLIEKQLGEQDLGIPGAETDIKVNNLEYVIEVEKGSNKLLGMNIMTDMSIGAGEEAGTMNIISDITMNYSNHNAVGEIVVPAEALEAAEVGLE